MGYDERFLDAAVPLPSAAAPTTLLAYPHFSVALDPARRLAAVTGVNIDGATLRDVARTGDWRLDPRVPADQQAGADIYARNDLDRGHLVRRRDPGWGSAAEARAATEATFVYPNAAPQASAFNQSKELWLGLEDHVLEYADAADLRTSVFTAPVLDDEDPPYRGIRIPRRFWKIAAWVNDGVLEAAGFVLDQSDLIDDAAAVAPLGAFRTFQVPIADIAELAAVEVGPLEAADVFETTSLRSGWRALRTTADIAL